MKNWKKFTLAGAALTAAVTLAACSSGTSSNASGKTPNMPIASAIQTLDQSVVQDAYSAMIVGNVQEGLTRSDNSQVHNALAKSISVSKDGLTYTITLQPNLYWTNPDGSKGDKITAQDFVYSWQRGDNPKTASQYAYLFAESNIKNAADINSGKAPVSSLGVVAKDDTTLVITLTTPTPYFKNLLSMPAFLPEDQKVVEKYGKAYGTSSAKMVYDGPFYMKSSEGAWTGSNNTYTMFKNPNYYDTSAVKSNSVNWQVVTDPNTGISLYKSGKLDVIGVGSATLYPIYKNNKDLKNEPNSENEYLEFNQSGTGTTSPLAAKALKDYNIREAITLATNREGLIGAVMPADSPATGFTPAGTGIAPNGQDFSKFAAQPYKYDATEAKTYWEKGLKDLGVTSLSLNFETDSDSPTGKQTADYMQKDLESALPGLTINEHIVPFAQRLKDSANGQFDIVVTLWGGDYSEPSTFMTLFMPGSGYNDGKFVNTAYNDAMKKATTLPDIMNNTALYNNYKAAEKALYDEASVDPLVFVNRPDLVNPKLQGVAFNATGSEIDMKTAYLTK